MAAKIASRTTERPIARSGALTSQQKSGVRVALVTAATVVTLMGAQILALGNGNRTTPTANTSNAFTNSADTSNGGSTQSLDDEGNVVFGNDSFGENSDSQYQYNRSNRSLQLAQSQPFPVSRSSR